MICQICQLGVNGTGRLVRTDSAKCSLKIVFEVAGAQYRPQGPKRLCYVTSITRFAMRTIAALSLAALALCHAHAFDVRNPRHDSTNVSDVPESRDKIALLHMVNDVWFFRDLAEISLRNKRRYAQRHGYEMVVHSPQETSALWEATECGAGSVKRGGKCYRTASFELDKRAPTFGKIKLALAACVGRDGYWLLWSDADALVVNQAKSLLDIVDDAYDLIVAHDWFMINAGVMLFKCSPWTKTFLQRVYNAREFDKATALDQSAFNSFFTGDAEVKKHVKNVPKWLINTYTEEYNPGDFIVHFAGKLYEATPVGIGAIARQFDVLSRVDDVEKISSFFNTRYLLNYYSGTCVMGTAEKDPNRDCGPLDPRRLKLPEPLGSMSHPNRYRQLEYRNPTIKDWKDPFDVPGATDIKIRRIPASMSA